MLLLLSFTRMYLLLSFFFFFNDTATTEIYTLSLHDALPISHRCLFRHVIGARHEVRFGVLAGEVVRDDVGVLEPGDRKSTRLNSSHANISYAVFCLKKKKKTEIEHNIEEKVSRIYQARSRTT